MQIGDLRYFVAVAEAESFAEAGRRLGPNNSTLSRRLMHLEDELGLTVFKRGQFGIRLTSAGKAVQAYF
jgi:DNA-binding transcriptional LysR family regulator